jgi:hypothetical protein
MYLPSHIHTPHSPARLSPDRVVDLGRLLIGLTVVALGVLYLLDGAGTLDAGEAVHDWWPALFVAAGVFTLLEQPPAVVRGTILTAGGTIGLLFTTDVLHDDAWSYIWPSLLIAAGLLIVARWGGHTIPAGTHTDDVVRSTAVFGGPKIVSTARSLRGGWLTAIFGGITLDLRGAQPAPEGASINATAAFGGIDILVPKGWRISLRTTPIFGGAEDKTDHSVAPAEDAPVLHVDAVCLFGGVDVKHEK